MSLKGSSTRADYIEWNTAVNLVHRLYRDGDYRMSLLIGCGIFFGLRISDLLQLSWDMLLDGDSFTLTEQKTGKRRTVRINRDFHKHIKACYKAMRVTNNTSKCFINATGQPLSIQRVNVLLNIYHVIARLYLISVLIAFVRHLVEKYLKVRARMQIWLL